VFPSNAQPFQRLLEDEVSSGGCAGDSVCPTLKHCSKLFIYLYKMATDSFDRQGYYGTSGPPAPVKALTDLKLHSVNPSHPASFSSSSDMVVIHPGAVLAMLDLLPSLAVANILQLLVNSERNQQVLCEACLHQRLLQRCSQALGDEDHPLHPPLQRMFERLASQALQPIALRYQHRVQVF
ncbi:hypothetical protein XENOCAPTIV_028662, partial [Xenoophorus captivus]